MEVVEDVVVGVLDVAGQGGVVEGGTAGATLDVDAVVDGLDGVSKDGVLCPL